MEYSNNDVANLANMIFGEVANQDYDTMVMVGSTAINRANSGKPKEFGSNLGEVLNKGYYAVSNRNAPYQQAVTGRFSDEASQNAYKKAYAVSSGLIKGTIQPKEGQFYFTDKEVNKLKRNPKKFNFKAVKELDRQGIYRVFSY